VLLGNNISFEKCRKLFDHDTKTCFCIELFTLHYNASMSCKAIVPKTVVIVILAMKLGKFLIAKSLKLGNRYLISIICMLLIACRIFSANNYSIEEFF